MRSGLIGCFGAIPGRIVCVLAVALLTCASSAHAQVIEEGGFPVKGGASGEPFSLSCPARLVVEVGESVLLLCAATAVPEEGVRYEWESLSGDGFHFLSALNELSPLFTAPLSEAGAEYVYRLTAMSVGVYETATVTVIVGGVSGGSVQDRGKSPGLLEGCDSFGVLEGGYGEGCVADDKAPPSFEPFEGGFEGEEGPGFLFPEAPGLPDRPSGPVRGGGLDRQAPPRLECPVAVFLEELETGAIECYASDAAGEEYLDYSWEPVGNTTRDYLDNPRLIPEDAPNPSVVAPEAPVYDTLESFRSGETTFRYQYRLTVTSRATGLSSSSEVEVYVSSSRPSVYCPLEIVVEEGETIALDCEGVDPLSDRMDYDEDRASILWEWEGLWGTSMAPLDATHLSSPLFTAPPSSAGEEYHYIVSMTTSASGVQRTARRKVTVKVAGTEGKAAIGVVAEGDMTTPARGGSVSNLQLTCAAPAVYRPLADAYFYGVVDTEPDIVLDCEASGGPANATYTYSWRGSGFYTESLLSDTAIRNPTYNVLNLPTYSQHRYTLRVVVTEGMITVDEAAITVIVTVTDSRRVIYSTVSSITRNEGDPEFTMDIVAVGGNGPGTYSWSGSEEALELLSATNILTPTFEVPMDVPENKTYVYAVDAMESGFPGSTLNITVRVRDTNIAVTCTDNHYRPYEGAGDIVLDCTARNVPDGATPSYSWTARGSTSDTAKLESTTIAKPTFAVPGDGEVDSDETYEYTLTVSAAGARDGTEEVTVTVLNKPSITVMCEDPDPVEEGGGEIELECRADGAPGADPDDYTWSWSPTTRLTGDTTATPTFDASNVGRDTTYTYTVTASAANAEDGTATVTVTVLDTYTTAIHCPGDPYSVDEGSGRNELDCRVENPPTNVSRDYQFTSQTSAALDLLEFSPDDSPILQFTAPPSVAADTTYEYTFTISVGARELYRAIASRDFSVTVRDTDADMPPPPPPPVVICNDSEVYEGATDIPLNCSVTNKPSGATYAWAARGSTSDTDDLTNTDSLRATFYVPDDIDEPNGADKAYEYTVTLSAGGTDVASADVTVTVLEKPDIQGISNLGTTTVLEGIPNFRVARGIYTGAPEGSSYEYRWTARNSTARANLRLSNPDIQIPEFLVPQEISADETYEYTLTVSAENADPLEVSYAVIVKNKFEITVMCPGNPYEAYEGSDDIVLDCSASGAPEGAFYEYAWTPRGSTTNTNKLIAGTDGPKPTFDVPDIVDSDETYEYTLTVSAGEDTKDGVASVTVKVLNKKALSVFCAIPASVYEGSEDVLFDCGASGAPGDDPQYTYAWTGDVSALALLDAADISSPTFAVPDEVESDETYSYTLTVSTANAEDATLDVAITVLNRRALSAVCTDPPLVYEGSADFALDCSATGAPAGSDLVYVWTARGSTANTDELSSTTIANPTFYVPEEVDGDETYEYTLTVSADNAESATEDVTVTVLNKKTLDVACATPSPVYEGSEDFALDCSATGAPAGSEPVYAWTARGSTTNTDLLVSGADGPTPTFDVPEEVDEDETYEYLLTVSAENAIDAAAEVTVKVLNLGSIALVCASPPLVYEGSEDFELDCSIFGDTGDTDYTYEWTARGATPNTDELSATDMPSPTFYVPDALDATTRYEYLLTARAANVEDATAEVTVTVLNRGTLDVACAPPSLVYEGSADFALDCTASGAPSGSAYEYAWTARGSTENTDLLTSGTDGLTPTFAVPDEVDENEIYEYLLTASADNAEDATVEVTVTVLNRGTLDVACAPPPLVYEGSADIALDCSASGAPGDNPQYAYAWTVRGNTSDTSLLSAADIESPTFYVPEEVIVTTTYEYLLTASAANAESGSAQVTVTVLDKSLLAVVCAGPYSLYEGSEDFALDCSASGAPGDDPQYTYVWTARGNTPDVSLLSATDVATPTFLVPDDLPETTTYEYLLMASATNAEDGSAEVSVTVMHPAPLAWADDGIAGRVYVFTVGESIEDIVLPDAKGGFPPYAYTLSPALPEGLELDDPARTISGTSLEVSPRTEYTWQATDTNAETVQLAFFIEVVPAAEPSPPVVESSPEAAEPSSLESLSLGVGVTVSASSLRFGVQSADTQVSLDPMTDGISTHVSGLYHGGRMTLSPGGSEALDENGEMDLSIELASPVVLRRKGGVEAASIVLLPQWSFAESCEQLSSQAIGGLYTEVTLSEDACRLLRFGGELDLTDVPSGQYAGSMDLILRSGEREETHSVEVDVTVIPAQQVITIGPRGVRFSTSRELPVGLTEEQNLSIYPHVAFLTEEKPNGAFELSNPSLIPLEVTVSARFGYTEVTEAGREVVVEDTSRSHLGDLSQVVDIHPNVLVLMPGEKGLVRYGVKEGALAAMAEKGYAAFFDVVSEPRQYVRSDRMPEEVTGERTARVTMRVPGVYVPGEGASQLRATLLSISYVGSLSATFLLETQDHPFVGEVVAYDGDGRELGRRETLVYTRSRVHIPLDRMPEEGTVFLRFAPRGSDRAPEPASIQWDAPPGYIGGDIGAADRDRTRPPETLARKP